MSTMFLIAQSYDKTGGSWMQMAEVLKTWKSGCQSFERCRTAYLDYQYLICQLRSKFLSSARYKSDVACRNANY